MVKKSLLVLTIFMILFTKSVFAWDSLGDYSHEALAYDAIHVLPSSEYPDLYRFEEQLKDGSKSEAPHEGLMYNGGNVFKWWNEKVKPSYKSFDFSEAYLQIGEVCHLTQDQAVPAHAANINHVITLGDDLEKYADSHYVSNPTNGYEPGSLPNEYYQPLQNSTWSDLSTWTKPSTGEQYWVPAPRSTQDTTMGPWGHYGGAGNEDIYLDSSGNTERPDIVGSQIYMATRSSAGVFAAASRKLPPLVKNLAISGSPSDCPVIDIQTGNQISFKILENRKRNVKIFITVDSINGEPIISSLYGTGLPLPLTYSSTNLPWEGTYSVIWNGKLANGQYPSDGQHTLCVRIEDEDGNSSEERHEFLIDTNPPKVISTTPARGYTNASVITEVSVTFNEDMDVGVNPNSFCSISPSVAGEDWKWDGKRKVKLSYDTSKDLRYNEDYTVTVTTGTKDIVGNQMAKDYQFSFHTEKPKFTASISPAGVYKWPPYTVTHHLTITNLSKRSETFYIDVADVKKSSGWKGGYTLEAVK